MAPSSLIDVSRLRDLRFIRANDDTVQIGALTTYADLMASPLLCEAAPVLIEAAATVGAPQTRYRGTLGGNIANASPAGDMLPPLLALDAQVTLYSGNGQRTLTLAAVLRGPKQTCLAPGEIIHSITFPRLPALSGTVFLKLGNRRGMAISVVNAAVVIALAPDGRVTETRVALGAVAPTPVRSPRAESVLIGQRPSAELIGEAARAVLDDIAPITDVRASAGYRRQSAERLARRALEMALERAQKGRSV
jgi:carbon-monoxide dehydrogenase medium subunit